MTGKLILLLTALLPALAARAQQEKGFAVVELFTSEGCSSCPPADEALIEVARLNKSNVYLLEFHVDYWNNLGWQDPFSNIQYSGRQQTYGRLFRLSSIYTPQAIINGKIEFTGSDKNRLNATILQQSTASEPGAAIELTVQSANDKKIEVAYHTVPSGENDLSVALVQLQGQSRVKRGENEGKQLLHTHIVRDFKTVDAKTGQGRLLLILPAGLTARDCKLIAFLQNRANGHISGATQIALP